MTNQSDMTKVYEFLLNIDVNDRIKEVNALIESMKTLKKNVDDVIMAIDRLNKTSIIVGAKDE